METSPAISDHGLIGDLQTAALVDLEGSVDWFCCPRFDSPSVFASLLDRSRGGEFRIAPSHPHHHPKQLYFPDSAVLITRFMENEGVAELIDFMPIADEKFPTDRHRLVRIVRGVRGELPITLTCAPRFDYARHSHAVDITPHGVVFTSPELQLTLHNVKDVKRVGDGVQLTRTIKANEDFGVILEEGADTPPRELEREELRGLLEKTVRFWRQWLARSTYRGRWRETVNRSAITLKLMTYAPTGALVAAPTAALPEQVGGERNWDYRFTWVRDGSFSVAALLGLGYADEAMRFAAWLRQRGMEHVGSASGPVKIMYRVDGSSDLEEETLSHFSGYRDSRPVRIGNGAADQLQLDIYGEAMLAIYQAMPTGSTISTSGWTGLTDMMDWLAANWDQPEEGIWETRGGRQDFVYGRLMCWVAFDRAIRMARECARPADVDSWVRTRDAIYRQILQRGWSAERNAFVQYYGANVLDASLLLMPVVGFISPTDPLWQSTLDAIQHELVSDSLVYRYDPSASPDGLPGCEGTFSICTFWFVDALARSGRAEQARYVFEKMLTYANHVGLYSEEISPTGEQLGNFPQAFSHLSLISAAITLDQALNRQPILSSMEFARAA
jgi:GH15 family glucan-1,4-alpha-glucosidase